jgi:hypothetical protein
MGYARPSKKEGYCTTSLPEGVSIYAGHSPVADKPGLSAADTSFFVAQRPAEITDASCIAPVPTLARSVSSIGASPSAAVVPYSVKN